MHFRECSRQSFRKKRQILKNNNFETVAPLDLEMLYFHDELRQTLVAEVPIRDAVAHEMLKLAWIWYS